MGNGLGPYEKIRLLGQGGMAEVWEARRRDGSNETVALKTLRIEDAKDPLTVRRLIDEARLGERLQHPNLVRTLDVIQEENEVGIVMELVRGRTVTSLCNPENPMPLGCAVAIIAEMLQGLEHLHAAVGPDGHPLKLVHRDIKPSNLLVTSDGHTKIIDFGIALLQGLDRTRTQTGILKASLPYCSPEMARHEAIDARADLFSLGLVFHEMLTGQRVFSQSTEAAILSAVLWSPVFPVRQYRSDIPPALDALILSLLEKDPHRRPTSAREVLTALNSMIPLGTHRTAEEVAKWMATLAPVATVQRTALQEPTGLTAEARRPSDQKREPISVMEGRRSWRRKLGTVFVVVLFGLGLIGIGVYVAPKPEAAETTTSSLAPVPLPPSPPAVVNAPPPAPADPAPPRPVPARRKATAVPKGRGWMTVNVSSGWANVVVNGRALGPTPIFRHELPAGRHTLVVTRSDGHRKTQTFTVEPDKERKLSVEW